MNDYISRDFGGQAIDGSSSNNTTTTVIANTGNYVSVYRRYNERNFKHGK